MQKQEKEKDPDFPDLSRTNIEGGDKYLIWEPKGLFQVVKGFLYNMMELNLVMVIAVMAYNQPSAQALFYFGIFNAVIWPMS